jgi:hypothetical protein
VREKEIETEKRIALAVTEARESAQYQHQEEVATLRLCIEQLNGANSQLTTRVEALSAAVVRAEQHTTANNNNSSNNTVVPTQAQPPDERDAQLDELRKRVVAMEREHTDELQAQNDTQCAALKSALADVQKLHLQIRALEDQATLTRLKPSEPSEAMMPIGNIPAAAGGGAGALAGRQTNAALSTGMICQLIAFSALVCVLVVLIVSRVLDSVQQEKPVYYYYY